MIHWLAVLQSSVQENAHVLTEGSILTAIVAAGKIWDKVVGKKKDNERAVYQRRLEAHQQADNIAFAAINTTLAVIDTNVKTVKDEVSKIDDRLYDRLIQRDRT